MKLFVTLLLAFFFSVSSALALTPAPTATPDVNSFELFWPLVAGKTVTDPVYKLKLFKEQLRGALIFGSLQKADYSVFIAIKRSLELEKLLDQDNPPAAQKTASLVQQSLTKANSSVEKYKSAGNSDTAGIGPQMVTRLDNMTKLFTWLTTKNEQSKTLLQPLLDQVSSLKTKL